MKKEPAHNTFREQNANVKELSLTEACGCPTLMKSKKARGGYYCRSGAPCPHLKDLTYPCPIIDLARQFEESIIIASESGETERRVRNTIKDVTEF